MSNTHDRSVALSVETFRQRLLGRPVIPTDLFNEALAITRAKLHAKHTKFFSHRGVVRDQRDIDDNDSQLKAADQVFSMAGVYARPAETPRATPTVVLEYDPQTGVVRLVVASDAGETEGSVSMEEEVADQSDQDRVAIRAPHDGVREGAVQELLPFSSSEPLLGSVEYVEGPLLARRSRRISDATFRILMDEEDG